MADHDGAGKGSAASKGVSDTCGVRGVCGWTDGRIAAMRRALQARVGMRARCARSQRIGHAIACGRVFRWVGDGTGGASEMSGGCGRVPEMKPELEALTASR